MRKNDKKANNKISEAEKDRIIRMHGVKFKEWLATPGIELWIKVFFYIFFWYLRHPKQTFFMKYSTIRDHLINCGCPCTIDGIEEAFRILKNEESIEYYESGKRKKGGVGLIRVVYASQSKAEYVAAGGNPNKYIYRKVYLNHKRVYKFISVFTGECKTISGLANKSRIKKLILKRPASYVKLLASEFVRQMRESAIEKYDSSENMFLGFVKKYSSRYYNTSALTSKTILKHAINLQKVQDTDNWLNVTSMASRTGPYYEIIDPATGEFLEPLNSPGEDNKLPESVNNFFNSIK